MSQSKIKVHQDHDFDIHDAGQLETDYRRIIGILNSLEEQVKRIAVDKNISRLGDVLEGIYLLRKVMGIEGVK